MVWSDVLWLVAGFVLLIKGGDVLVDGARQLARSLGVSDLAVGLTVVAFGTSMPEFVVSLLACVRGDTAISIGNIVGSNIANVLLILGVAAIIFPPFATRGTVWKEIPFVLLASVVMAILSNDTWFDGASESVLSRGDGLILLCFFGIFLYYVGHLVASGGPEDAEPIGPLRPRWKSGLYVVIGLVLLVFGGDWVVKSAVGMAEGMGVSQRIIGLTVVAVGTSLPELATSAVAAYRRNSDIAVGNVVGSNIFNLLWILGVSSVVTPLPFDTGGNIDVAVMVAAAFLLFVAMFTGRPRHQLQRVEGGAFVALYAAYVGWLVLS